MQLFEENLKKLFTTSISILTKSHRHKCIVPGHSNTPNQFSSPNIQEAPSPGAPHSVVSGLAAIDRVCVCACVAGEVLEVGTAVTTGVAVFASPGIPFGIPPSLALQHFMPFPEQLIEVTGS